ncbi:MAG: iron-sulfur cluster carrier protein ApbC [Legionellales bacterium]|nr:MAG: iron-sulfur cluster carrier protein ApbC [Legionellales bacterium]
MTEDNIKQVLANYKDQYLKTDLITSNVLESINVSANNISLKCCYGYPIKGLADSIEASISKLLHDNFKDIKSLKIKIIQKISNHQVSPSLKSITDIKNIIAVASGKGGVGKSTVSVNLALALKSIGASVGILDADIYGPSQPIMLGTQGQSPSSIDKTTLEPVAIHGIQSMSIGYLIDDMSAMIWRGPMASKALQQLMRDTNWQKLDYLIIDLPPGTGDIQLTMSQKIPVTAAIVVTTPQDLALADARRAIAMFNKVKIPVLGIVENMSTYICAKCGHVAEIFGADGGEKLADEQNAELLAKLPLDMKVRQATDAGQPLLADGNLDSKDSCVKDYIELARRTAAKLSLFRKDYSFKFPNITIKQD